MTWLAETVQSILNQSIREIELVVVDDASTDATPEIMGAFVGEDHRVVYERFSEQVGAAKCRNHGNRVALSPLIHVADSGDIYHHDAAKTAVRYMTRNPDVDIFYSSVALIDERGRVLGLQHAAPYVAGKKINFSHPTVCYRRSVALHEYRETSLHTDQYEAFFLERALSGTKFGFTKEVLLLKREIATDGSGRDMAEARKVKRGIYDEFGLEWPFEEPEREAAAG